MDNNDKRMTDMIYARDEDGLRAAAERYGSLCRRVAAGILASPEDAEECFNDALLAVWISTAQPPRVALRVYMPHHAQHCDQPLQGIDLPKARRRGHPASAFRA